jgi:hypothetical protein
MNCISYSLKSLEQIMYLMAEMDAKGYNYYIIYGRHKLFTLVWIVD